MPLSKERQREYQRKYRKRAKLGITIGNPTASVIPKLLVLKSGQAMPVKPQLDADGGFIPDYW